MLHSQNFTVVLDACVLYPAPVRDILLSLAAFALFKPKWSNKINEEWKRSLLKKRKDIPKQALENTEQQMNNAFQDALVINYKPLEAGLKLPDKNDLHVLAAAIKCNADVIVTFNLKDFPKKYIQSFDIEVQDPDTFICNIIDLDEGTALKAFKEQVNRLKNPKRSISEVLETFRNCGLNETANTFWRLAYPEQTI